MEQAINPKDFMNLLQNPIFLMAAVWAIREIVRYFKEKNLKGEQALTEIRLEHTKAIKESSERMNQLSISLVKLETKLESFEHAVYTLPKLENDLNTLYAKFRRLDPHAPQS